MLQRLLGLLLLTASSGVIANDASGELVKKLGAIQSSQAQFKQVTLDGRGDVLQQTSGEMWVQRPNHFKWSVTEPYQQVIWSDADSVWMYDIDLEQVVHNSVSQQAGNAPSLLLSGDPNQITQHFSVKKTLERGDQSQFELTPKDDESTFQTLSVVFKKTTLLHIELIDHLGQRTAIRFNEFQSNHTISANIFTPNYPDTVDVIENTAL